MREIVVISGKGGTGKTTICASLAAIAASAGERPVLCDLDVDVPDLHIILKPKIYKRQAFISGNTATINQEACTLCGRCMDLCQFGAITKQKDSYHIDQIACEGCGVCYKLCPSHAVDFPPRHCGMWYLSQTRFGSFLHAQLDPGQENSGRLVNLLKQQARETALSEGSELVLCDGSPGIGCPVISSLSGASLAVAVVEPTPSGLHDFERLAELCKHFHIPVAIIINKADLNTDAADALEKAATNAGHTVVGRLPFSPLIVQAMARGEAVAERDSPLTDELARIWRNITVAANERTRKKTNSIIKTL